MNTAEFLTSPALSRAGFRHAFFTRNGGASVGPYASLSFSIAVGDHPDNVRENLVRAARALDVAPDKLFFLSQVHGRDVHRVDAESSRETVLVTEGDALVSSDPSVGVGVRSADCVPVLIADQKTGSVAAVHAGWRGVELGAVAAAVRHLAAEPRDLVAAIGPHISLEAFEVSDEVAARLRACSPDPNVVSLRPGARPHVDLRRLVRAQLVSLGLAPSAVDDVPGCTMLEPGRFFSFRRDGAKSGRHLSAIVPRGLHA
ncbi:MAG: peptidoglycan editing factor PgeF [Polyangiaceae bacterium]|nr:peptidoglycan editing factor PgeF [Polyangiaceae bacterium]